jgi:heme-degrading monooxygenase HmoA
MIARVWHGSVPAELANAYGEYLAGFGVTDYQRVPGNLGVGLHRRDEGAVSHFLMLSYWANRQALEAYAGADCETAHYYAYDLECLIQPSTTVQHYEVVARTGAPVETA